MTLPKKFRSPAVMALPFSLVVLLASCSLGEKYVYRIDVQQGNDLAPETTAQLKPGLSKDQVRYLLGTPLLTDMFHADRWDYVYRMQPGRGEVQQRRMSLFFADGKLTRVEGDVVAAEAGSAETPANRMREVDLGRAPEGAAAPLPEERGWFGRMMEKIGF